MAIPKTLTVTSVQAWAEQLPYANAPLIARETFELIERLTDAGLSNRDRIMVLEIVKHPVGVALDRIQAHLVSGDHQTGKLLGLGETYCERLIALCESDGTNKWKEKLLPGRESCMRRESALVTHFFERWRLLRAVDHHAAPAGFWFAMKKHYGLSYPDQKAVFGRLLALELAATPAMSSHQIQNLVETLHDLPTQRLVRVGKPVTKSGKTGFFFIDDDFPPTYGEIPIGATPLDLGGLVKYLEKTQFPKIEPVKEMLLDRWKDVRPEREPRPRMDEHTAATVVLGFRGIVRYLRSLGFGAAVSDDDLQEFSLNMTPMSFNQTSTTSDATILDSSTSGCRLSITWVGMQINDVIAVEWGQNDWRVGKIVWMIRSGELWKCGVHWLLEKPAAALVRLESGIPVAGLLGQSSSENSQVLLYDAASGRAASSILVKTNGLWEPHRVFDAVQLGPLGLARAEKKGKPSMPTEPSVDYSHVMNAPTDEVWRSIGT